MLPVDQLVKLTPGQLIFFGLLILLSGGGLAAIIEAVRTRGKPRADITATVSAAAAEVVQILQNTINEAQQDAQEARLEAQEARKASRAAGQEAEEARRQMRTMRLEMEMLAYRFRHLVSAILDDNVTREHLKVMARAPLGGSENGQGS